MNGWMKIKLEDTTSKLGDGLHGTPRYDQSGEYYFINGSNLKNGKIVIKLETKRISSEEYHRISKELNDRTILVAINGTLGNVGLYGGEKVALGKSACYFHVNSDVNKSFIRYNIEHSDFQSYAWQHATGSTIKNLSLRAMRDYSFYLPSLKTQNRIASTIETYDDLIENNQKRISILEEMAQRLYTEWFIKFKFPGYEKVKMTDSGTEFGMIPDGWEVKRLSEFASLTMGQSPKSEFYNENGEGLPFHQGVSNFGYLYPENKVYSSKGNRIAKKGELLFSVRAPVGKLNIATSEMILGRGLASIRHKQNWQSFLLSMFFNKFTENDMLGNGSIYKSINKSELENLLFVIPSEELMEIFEPISEKYFEKLNILTQRVTNLSRTRDLLIENLVTGKRLLKN